jgi:hypothetical protein
MKIAWLGLLDSDDVTASTRAHDHLVRLAQQVVAASGHVSSIELISCGRDPGCHTISLGVERVVLPLAGSPRTVWDRVSWAMPAAISSADLVHLHDGFSRSCEMALLIAKQGHKPVCTTEWGIEGYWLSSELALRELSDVVVCHDVAVAQSITRSKPVELVACRIDVRHLGVPAPWPANECVDADVAGAVTPDNHEYVAAGSALCRIYRTLVHSTRRAAA